MLAVFCTNAINIYAGVNGLESGQGVVLAAAVALHNTIEIFCSSPFFSSYSSPLLQALLCSHLSFRIRLQVLFLLFFFST